MSMKRASDAKAWMPCAIQAGKISVSSDSGARSGSAFRNSRSKIYMPPLIQRGPGAAGLFTKGCDPMILDHSRVP